jgi:hypothetical protein
MRFEKYSSGSQEARWPDFRWKEAVVGRDEKALGRKKKESFLSRFANAGFFGKAASRPVLGDRTGVCTILNRFGQPFPKRTVAFQIPFTAHGVLPGRIALRIQQEPNPSACRARTTPGIVPSETSVQIVGPADVGSMSALACTNQNVYEAPHD